MVELAEHFAKFPIKLMGAVVALGAGGANTAKWVPRSAANVPDIGFAMGSWRDLATRVILPNVKRRYLRAAHLSCT